MKGPWEPEPGLGQATEVTLSREVAVRTEPLWYAGAAEALQGSAQCLLMALERRADLVPRSSDLSLS